MKYNRFSEGSILFALLMLLVPVFAACDEAGPENGLRPAERQDHPSEMNYNTPRQPEIGTGYTPKPGWETSEFAVAAANPLAADAGYQVLQNGGSAVDAAVAIQMVLTLTEPQSSGIGGGAFLMHWDGETVGAYDGREIAPAGAGETLFLDDDGEPLPFDEAVHSGRSVGVPGTLAMLKTVHEKYGRLPWEELFRPAITLAGEGFSLSPRLHQQLTREKRLPEDEIARNLFYDEDGNAHPSGYILKNPALAENFRKIAEEGITVFYEGVIAADIVRRVQEHPDPGPITVDDMARYPTQNLTRDPICTPWLDYTICGFPPPSSGHLTMMQALGIMEHLDAPEVILQDSVPTAEWLHHFFESFKLAFADRNRYIADPAFIDPPGDSWETMLHPEYLQLRAAQIGNASMGIAEPGDPGSTGLQKGRHPEQPDQGTSHISIIDRYGNAVSMTTTIEQGFGSRIMSDGGTGLPGGFLLNNELTDFSLSPTDSDGVPIANRVEPGKRPRSSMSPTLVFDRDGGRLLASVGSPGGAAIIHYTAKTLIGMYVFGLNAQEAIDLPNFVNTNGPSVLEEGRFPREIMDTLEAMGHEVAERSLTSGIQAIRVTEDGFFGGADPRREGVVMGE